jgi:hypothetical protein
MAFEHFAHWLLAGVLALGALISPATELKFLSSQPPLHNQRDAARSVRVYAETVTLPTYPIEQYQSNAFDPVYHWRYQRFDYDRFRDEAPQPTARTYHALVMENEYLRITLLPELGGRIWRVVHKPTGADIFYRNEVVKPTPWGPPGMQGWLNVGGIEWGLPVVEHGYAWGVPWDATVERSDGGAVTVALTLPDDGQALTATIRVTLRAGEGSFEIAPTVTNLTGATVAFDFWHNAMLAPGKSNHPSAATRFILPTDAVTIHSTADLTLPSPNQPMSWPIYDGRDLSRLGAWRDYLGFFERPAAHGPFVALYDEAQDAGVARVFPAETVRGSKVFGLGWRKSLPNELYTDDDSAYVELHAGLAPTFFERATLAGGASVSWREVWLPLGGIGGVRTANTVGALNWRQQDDDVQIRFQPARSFAGELVIMDNAVEIARLPVKAAPAQPWTQTLAALDAAEPLQWMLKDATGAVVLESR